MRMEHAYQILFSVVLISLGIGILFALIRAIKGPRTADHIVGINMIGTLSLLSIAVIALALKESWLLDVSIIYGMISFLALAVLCTTRLGQKKTKYGDEEDEIDE